MIRNVFSNLIVSLKVLSNIANRYPGSRKVFSNILALLKMLSSYRNHP